MGNHSLQFLASEVEKIFGYLRPAYEFESIQFFGEPGSARAGFRLSFSGAQELTLSYQDWLEFEIELGGKEVFGANRHPQFGGNQFSPEHLLEHLPAIAEAVALDLVPHSWHAV